MLGPAAAVGLATLGGSVWAYRLAYPGMIEQGQREILGALEAVAAAGQSDHIFGTLPGPARPRRLDASDGAAATIIAGARPDHGRPRVLPGADLPLPAPRLVLPPDESALRAQRLTSRNPQAHPNEVTSALRSTCSPRRRC